jgi:hypothetical protein
VGELVTWAYEQAEACLRVPLPRRWAHVQGVSERARVAAPLFSEDDAALLVAAALLHDVGLCTGHRSHGSSSVGRRSVLAGGWRVRASLCPGRAPYLRLSGGGAARAVGGAEFYTIWDRLPWWKR